MSIFLPGALLRFSLVFCGFPCTITQKLHRYLFELNGTPRGGIVASRTPAHAIIITPMRA
jgi:hypothetical protein